MALTVVSTPQYLHVPTSFDSDAASTEQLLYHFNEDDLVGKESYVLKVVIPELDDLTNFYVPDSNGDIVFDIGKWVRLAMGLTPLIDFKITYNGQWRGGSTTPADTIFIMAVSSRRQQMLNDAGANLFDYLLNPTLSRAGNFLTVFEEPCSWVGQLQTLEIINQDFADYDIKEDYLDINKQQLSTFEYVKTGEPLRELANISQLFFTHVAPYVRYTVLDTDPSQTPISQTIIIKLLERCPNSIFLKWRNSLGGEDFWMFGTEQAVTNIASEGFRAERPLTLPLFNNDPDRQIGNKYRAGSTNTQHLTLKADQLTRNQVEGLHDIKLSDDVFLVNESHTGVRVTISGLETSYTTGKGGYIFTLNIEMPDNFDFFDFTI